VADNGAEGRPAKGKDRPGAPTISIRVSPEYADWLTRAAKADRAKVATFLDRAAADRARAIGFTEPPPDRVPASTS